MKQMTIKQRVTMWYTLFMVIVVAFSFSTLYFNGRRMVRDYYASTLMNTAVLAEDDVHRENGMLEIDRNLDSLGDVRVSLYDMYGQLLYGRVYFDLAFDDGSIRTAEDYSGEKRYVHDRQIVFDGEESIWLRCHIASTATGILRSVGTGMWILLPVAVVLAALGGYWIARRAFLPVKEIAQTAESIVDGTNLKNRIELHDTQDELYAIASVFNDMLDRLETAFESERRFTSDAAHELRTPVSAILVQTDFALSDLADEEDRIEALTDIRERAQQMSDLIQKLLSMTRMDAGQLRLCFEEIDLRDLTDAAVVQIQDAAEKRHMTVVSDSQSVSARCDQTMLLQAVMNLAENAVKYGKDGGKIEIRAYAAPGGACIEISDDGQGISEENLSHLFERFYQCDASRHSAGAGLGLPLVKRIAELHGGSINVKSTPGKGSIFTIFIPEKERDD